MTAILAVDTADDSTDVTTGVRTAPPSTKPHTRPTAVGGHLRVVVRPAPLREPPFDDELVEPSRVGPLDRRLPFVEPVPPPVRALLPTHPAGLPDPAVWGRRLLIGLIESAAGRRPIQQLSSLLSMSVGRGLRQHFEQPTGPHWLSRASVRSVLAGHPADGVAELAVTVESGGRVRAVAVRLEERRGRWCCTRLQLG